MRLLKLLLYTILGFFIFFLCFLLYFGMTVNIKPPVPANTEILSSEREEIFENHFRIGANHLRLSESGLWELYLQGEAFERGAVYGILAKDLIYRQEKAFVEELKKMIPSDFYLRFLKYFVAWFNRDLDKHVKEEYLLEIFGVSHAASDEFSFVGPPYLRMLNYHAAHDIGHTLQNMGMVGCTSFAVWDENSEDSTLLVGRNFDFYVGDDFSKEKIVAFYKPEQGHPFMFVTWGGMVGVVSGMNNKGLCITINALPSDLPFQAKTPVSLVARDILQYAANIEEAVNIASQYETFVAESFLIGSAFDNKAVVIEKAGEELAVYEAGESMLSCANHFQSENFYATSKNTEALRASDSPFRQRRMRELLEAGTPVDYLAAAKMLRDQKGPLNTNIGMGNPYAINQLIAHHAVIFSPAKLMVWVSTAPFQLGKFVAYDLNQIFESDWYQINNTEITVTALEIPADSFLLSQAYRDFLQYKKLKQTLLDETKNKRLQHIDDDWIVRFISLNPSLPAIYELVAAYYKSRKKNDFAKFYHDKAAIYQLEQ